MKLEHGMYLFETSVRNAAQVPWLQGPFLVIPEQLTFRSLLSGVHVAVDEYSEVWEPHLRSKL